MIFLPTVYVIILAVILQLEFCSSSASQDNNLKNKYEVIKQSNGPFCDSFLKAVSSSKNENVLISPLSLHYALSALFLGSFGQTRTELRKILHLPNNENVIKAAFKEFTGLLKVNKNVKIGTTFFLDEEFPIVDSFQNDLRSNFDASVETLDFKNRSEDSRLMINNFVKNKTNNLIHDLFGKGSITENTVSVLVNTIHFKAQWIHPFARTSKKNFHGFDGNNKIDMMYISDVKLRYKNDDELNAQLLEVPYEGGFKFLIILPNKKKGLIRVEKKLKSKSRAKQNSSALIEAFRYIQEDEVDLFLPKFKLEQSHELEDILKTVTVQTIFINIYYIICNAIYFTGQVYETVMLILNFNVLTYLYRK
ncbi:serpin B11-like isoform X2 [Lycorma delicatula]|uniref:serpin B11-like isoform X2 n=1 Tax=Lycorma delicatula TaxID=130591 RepID=UPI003F519C95